MRSPWRCSLVQPASIAFLLGFAAVDAALAQARFRIVYDSIRVDSSYSVLSALQTADLGYATSGRSTGAGAFLLKLDRDGVTVFATSYDLHATPALDEVASGGFILAGEHRSYEDPSLLRVDAAGVPLWAMRYDQGSFEQGFYVAHPTPDGGWLASGIATVKLDAGGAILWSKIHIAGGGNTNGMAITPDGGSVHTGEGQYGNTGMDYNLVVTKLDAGGTIQWNKVYAGDAYDWGADVKPTLDGGYIVTGWTRSFGSGSRACFLLKSDALGVFEWANSYSGASGAQCQSVAQTADLGYAMTGAVDGVLTLIKTDPLGGLSWVRAYGGATLGYALDLTADGGYLIAGVTGNALTVIKTDASGDAATCNQSTPAVLVVPAPFRSGLNSAGSAMTWTPAPLAAMASALSLPPGQPPCAACTITAVGQATPAEACAGATIDLTANGSGVGACLAAVAYRWTGSNGYLRDWSTVAFAADTPAISTTYTVAVRCPDPGCETLSAGIPVVIHPTPGADAGPPQAICAEQVTLGGAPTATLGTPPYDYLWSAVPADPTLSCTGGPACANPTARPLLPTVYTVVVSDAGSCMATASTTVAVTTPAPPRDVGNSLRAVRDYAAVPAEPTSISIAWAEAGGSATAYNLRRSDSRSFAPPNGIVFTVAPGAGARLLGEVRSAPALRLYRTTTSNCAGVESPI